MSEFSILTARMLSAEFRMRIEGGPASTAAGRGDYKTWWRNGQIPNDAPWFAPWDRLGFMRAAVYRLPCGSKVVIQRKEVPS